MQFVWFTFARFARPSLKQENLLFIECSAKANYNVKNLFRKLATSLPGGEGAGAGGGGGANNGGAGGGGGGAPAGFLSQLTGGTRTALKAKAITVESAREKLVKLVKGEKSQVDKIPIKLADFNVVVEALEAVINASDDQFANVAKAKLEELKQQDKEVSDTTTATTTATTNNNNNNNNN